MQAFRKREKDFSSLHWRETWYLVASCQDGEECIDVHRNPVVMLRLVWQPLSVLLLPVKQKYLNVVYLT